MALSDREKLELAEVFEAVLEPKMQALYSEIAKGFVVILEEAMKDLAAIFKERNRSFVEMMEQREKQAAARHKSAGFGR